MKRIFLLITAAIFIFTQPTYSFARDSDVDFAENSKSAILIERDTGTVLFEKNSREALPPASMTKVMTMLLIMEALDSGKLTLDEKIRTSEYAASMGGSQIFLEEGEEMTVDELLRGIAVASANDASVALSEKLAGSEEAFVQMMNDKAKELGLKNTKFQNSTGLPADNHYSSAYDMAMLAKELLKHEEITKYTSLYESYLRENTDKKFWLVNTNKLVRFYTGADGLKTGFTRDAGYCLTATAKKDNMRVIAVVFGAPSSKERNKQITNLFNFAFSQYATVPFHKKGETLGEVKVPRGEKRMIPAKTEEPISVLVKKGENTDQITKEVSYHKDLKAPLKKGDPVGEVTLYKDGKVLSKSTLIAGESVDTASWWTFFKRSFGIFTKTK